MAFKIPSLCNSGGLVTVCITEVLSYDRLCECAVGLHRFGDSVTTNRGLALRVSHVPRVDREFAKPSVFVRALSSASKF